MHLIQLYHESFISFPLQFVVASSVSVFYFTTCRLPFRKWIYQTNYNQFSIDWHSMVIIHLDIEIFCSLKNLVCDSLIYCSQYIALNLEPFVRLCLFDVSQRFIIPVSTLSHILFKFSNSLFTFAFCSLPCNFLIFTQFRRTITNF